MCFYFLSFSYIILLYTGFVTIYLWHTMYLFSYIWWCILFFTYLLMCCFFSLFIHMFIYVCNLYFCFKLWSIDEFCLKCFRKTGCENQPCYEFSSCKVFQKFMLGLNLFWIQQVFMSLVIYDFSHDSFVCCGFVTDCQRGRLLGHMWELLDTYAM